MFGIFESFKVRVPYVSARAVDGYKSVVVEESDGE